MFDIKYWMEPSQDAMCETKTPAFDVGPNSSIHRVQLQDEDIEMPERDKDMPKRLYDDLVDEAWALVAENRKKNTETRRRLKIFSEGDSPTIEIVADSGKTKKPDAKSASK
ncbi:MAG TPA: hypothetical protein VGF98_01105 [Candidatus Tumulicola sp.]